MLGSKSSVENCPRTWRLDDFWLIYEQNSESRSLKKSPEAVFPASEARGRLESMPNRFLARFWAIWVFESSKSMHPKPSSENRTWLEEDNSRFFPLQIISFPSNQTGKGANYPHLIMYGFHNSALDAWILMIQKPKSIRITREIE